MARNLGKAEDGPCHVLSLSPAVAQVISMDHFMPYLPERLKRFKLALLEDQAKTAIKT